MRTTFDFSPLYRSGIGFDRMLTSLEATSRGDATESCPPYDIIKIGDDDYRIAIAVAGFSAEELTLTQEGSALLVTGQKATQEKAEYLHRGIAERSFRRRFQLADHVKVKDASLANGLLTIDLRHEIPEEMKPRQIEIIARKGLSKPEAKQINRDQRAA